MLAPNGARAADLSEVLASFDRAQSSFETLSADFVQTTTNPILKNPVVAVGRFYMTKPDSIRWEYETPEEMSFVIANDHYTGYFPGRKRAERKNVQRYSERIFRYFGLGQGSEQLAKYYDIRLDEPASESPEEYLLRFDPKKRRARKRVDEVRFWIDAKSFLPIRVEYCGKDGSTRVVEFTEIRLDPELDPGLYLMTIPEDVTVSVGFGGIPSFGPGADD
jgi:outer membrane lipoprotein-sorting protein